MKRPSPARRERRNLERVMQAAGVEAVHRRHVGFDVKPAILAREVATAVEALADLGAVFTERTVITIGQHPNYPGVITIEAKASKKVEPTRVSLDDCDCPVDHGEPDDDELVEPTPGGGAA